MILSQPVGTLPFFLLFPIFDLRTTAEMRFIMAQRGVNCRDVAAFARARP
jgi:hypothetical protein